MDHWDRAHLGLILKVGIENEQEKKKWQPTNEDYIRGFLLEPGAKLPVKEPLTWGKIFRFVLRMIR